MTAKPANAADLPPIPPIPCASLIETDSPRCEHGRAIPSSCRGCPDYHPGLTAQERTRCEIWSRVMGYHRPVSAYNPGKQQEHADRTFFTERA